MRAASSAKPASRAGLPIDLVQPSQGRLRVADEPCRVRVAAPDLQRIGVDLHDLRVERRHGPVQRDLVAGIAADEQHEIGAVHDAVGRRRGIAAGDTGRQPMPGRDDAAGAERRRDRRLQRLGQCENLRPGLRSCGPVAGDDRDAAGRGQRRGGALDVGASATGRCAGIRRASGSMTGGSAVWPSSISSPWMTGEVEMGRPRRVRQRGAPSVTQQPRQFGGQVDRGREFRHRGEQRRVRDFLVGVAMLKRRRLAAGQRDDRAAPEKGVLQSGRQIGGADRLRHAHPGPPGDRGHSRRPYRPPPFRNARGSGVTPRSFNCSSVRRSTDSTKKTCVVPAPASARASHSAPFIVPDRSLLSSPGSSLVPLAGRSRLRPRPFRRLRCETATDTARQRSRNSIGREAGHTGRHSENRRQKRAYGPCANRWRGLPSGRRPVWVRLHCRLRSRARVVSSDPIDVRSAARACGGLILTGVLG